MSKHTLNYLEQLEAESIHIFREVRRNLKDRRFYSVVVKILSL